MAPTEDEQAGLIRDLQSKNCELEATLEMVRKNFISEVDRLEATIGRMKGAIGRAVYELQSGSVLGVELAKNILQDTHEKVRAAEHSPPANEVKGGGN